MSNKEKQAQTHNMQWQRSQAQTNKQKPNVNKYF